MAKRIHLVQEIETGVLSLGHYQKISDPKNTIAVFFEKQYSGRILEFATIET
jgi:hypothetical protein